MRPALSRALERDFPHAMARVYVECQDGWYWLLRAALHHMEKSGVFATQIKEKFGGLRIYTGALSEMLDGVITGIEDASYSTCEVCGAPGHVETKNRWLRVRCTRCAESEARGV